MPEIPQSVLDEIKRRIDIGAVISEHVALKRSGRGFLGLCPFHEEKTPSFNVDPERGFFHCFGCGAGGNAFTFVTRITGATFPEVARRLAERAGVTIPESRSGRGLDRLAEVNGLAADLFQIILHQSKRGEPGLRYLEQRGIDLDTAKRFGMGFAPSDLWVDKLLRKEVTPSELERLGLVRPSRISRGTPYPLFRDRLIFPIRDLSGRVIAFGGRLVGDAKGPKYLNSPETPLYRKGHHLYGLDLARDTIRETRQVILVEGYLDAIALAQVGLTNVAAILGTAVTADQLKLARRFADDVVICFDGDQAGRRAALRAFPICVDEVDLWPRAVFLPPGDDPDTLVRRGGAAAMQELIRTGPSLIDFFLDDLVGPDAGLGETARAASRMAEVLAKVKDPIVRDKLVRGAAGRLGVSGDTLLDAARRIYASAHATSEPRKQGTPAPRTAPAPPPRRARFSTDAELVELLFCDEEVSDRVRLGGVQNLIADPALREIAERVLARRETDEYFEPFELLFDLPRDMAERIRRRLESPTVGHDTRAAAEEWFQHRAGRAARGDRKALIARLRAAEHRGDRAEIDAALEALRDGPVREERDEPLPEEGEELEELEEYDEYGEPR